MLLGNFTNICYSLALRHQINQCYLCLNPHQDPREVGPGKSTSNNFSFIIFKVI